MQTKSVYLCQSQLFEIKWNHLTVWKKLSLGLFINVIDKMCLEIYLIYRYKNDLALNNQQCFIAI